MKRTKKDGSAYFHQTATVRTIGGIILGISLVWWYVGISMASYYGPLIMMPIGLLLLIIGGVGYVKDSDITEEISRMMIDFDREITDSDDISKRILRHPSDVVTEAFNLSSDANYFKKTKDGSVISDLVTRSHIWFTQDSILLCARTVYVTEMNVDTKNGYSDLVEEYPFSQISSVELKEEILPITITNTKKQANIKCFRFILKGSDGTTLADLPSKNDMSMSTLCEEIERRIAR